MILCPIECKKVNWSRRKCHGNGLFKELQKLKDLKKYSREWKKSSLQAWRSDFLSKKWCGKRENARGIELGIVTIEEEEERRRRRKKDDGAKSKRGPKFWPPCPFFYLSC